MSGDEPTDTDSIENGGIPAVKRADSTPTLTLYADYVCPFCYLGRASLTRYLETREEPLVIDWHPFDLRADRRGPDDEIDPDAEDGKDEAYYENARENVRRLAEEYGVEMSRNLAIDVDSRPAQIASMYVKEHVTGRWPAFDGAVYDALWVDERDVGDPEVLASLAEDVGLEGSDVESALGNVALDRRISQAFADARREGITGVPTFEFEGRVARGAVPPAHLQRLVEGE